MMPNLQGIIDSQKELEETLGSRMASFEKLLRSPQAPESKPNLEKLAQEFFEFKTFSLSVLQLLRSQIHTLASQVDELDCSNRRNAMMFGGIPEMDGENCAALVLNIIQTKMNMPNTQASAIYLCHRLGARSNTRDRPILVRFSSISVRDAVWREKKRLKSSSTVVHEFLTKTRHNLFITARRHFGVTASWTSNGAIYIMLPDNNRRRIGTAEELKELMAKYPSVATGADIVAKAAPLSSVSSVAAAVLPKASPKQTGGSAGTSASSSGLIAAAAEPLQTRRTAAVKSKPSK